MTFALAPLPRWRSCWCSVPAPALAQYKIVAPDGRVTYTDRPPADASLRITTLGRRVRRPPAPVPGRTLPAELQRIAARFPVTLFSADDCPPCDTGRELLRQRGVPYTERRIASNDDVAALERMVGGRTVPALTVGGQALRGYSSARLGLLPRRRRLPARIAPAARLGAAAADAAGGARAPARRSDPRRRARRRRRPSPAEVPPTPEGATGIRF